MLKLKSIKDLLFDFTVIKTLIQLLINFEIARLVVVVFLSESKQIFIVRIVAFKMKSELYSKNFFAIFGTVDRIGINRCGLIVE